MITAQALLLQVRGYARYHQRTRKDYSEQVDMLRSLLQQAREVVEADEEVRDRVLAEWDEQLSAEYSRGDPTYEGTRKVVGEGGT